MIKFLNDQIRGDFHLLPVDTQKAFQIEAEYFADRAMTLTILFVDPETSEVSVRVDKQFDDPA